MLWNIQFYPVLTACISSKTFLQTTTWELEWCNILKQITGFTYLISSDPVARVAALWSRHFLDLIKHLFTNPCCIFVGLKETVWSISLQKNTVKLPSYQSFWFSASIGKVSVRITMASINTDIWLWLCWHQTISHQLHWFQYTLQSRLNDHTVSWIFREKSDCYQPLQK
jgi:hypothetical protein